MKGSPDKSEIQSHLGKALQDVSKSYVSTTLSNSNSDLGVFIITFNEGFLFAPEAQQIREEKLGFINAISDVSKQFPVNLKIIGENSTALSNGRIMEIFASLQSSNFKRISFGYDPGASALMEWHFVEVSGGT